jgi:transcriptional regulator with XRE-family HTH domain
MASLNEQTRRKVGEYVEGRRLAQGLSIAEASKRAKLSDTKWYQVEKGTTNHRPVTLRKVARGLGETPRRIFELAELPFSEGPEVPVELEERVAAVEVRLGDVEETVDQILDRLGGPE